MSVAFLRVLCPSDVTPDMEKIREKVLDEGFKEIRPYEEYTPDGLNHRLVVWRFNNKDTLTDKESRLVGEGGIMYLWRCHLCGSIVSKIEHPCNHETDTYYGCSCPGTTWGYPIL